MNTLRRASLGVAVAVSLGVTLGGEATPLHEHGPRYEYFDPHQEAEMHSLHDTLVANQDAAGAVALPSLVTLEGAETFRCDRRGSSSLKRSSDPGAEYCPGSKTAVIPAGSLNFTKLARPEHQFLLRAFVVAHEAGHGLDDADPNKPYEVTGANFDNYGTIPERRATCFAGTLLVKTHPEATVGIGDAVLATDLNTSSHGTAEQQRAAFMQGAEIGDCSIAALS